MTNWEEWRKCTVCLMPTGTSCVSRSGKIVNGQPDQVVTRLLVPHRGRRMRTAAARAQAAR